MKKNKITKKNLKLKKKGFSLVEVLVAVSIFAFTSVLIAGVFSGFLKNSIEAKKNQKNMESARYALDLMAKTLRTSVASSIADEEIHVFDNTQKRCVIYKYDNANKKMLTGTSGGASLANVSACTPTVWSGITLSDLTSSGTIASANFSGTAISLGRITMSLGIPSANPNTYSSTVQTTVSLRQ
ncbi:MAG: hypothetical protein US25_C0002G0001 [Candidatus Moranbacteria bacterium GW2011_GWE1_36_7]|nr:MAG: hypothetical protein UR99_C0011G0001 [Candidatus Moranbacteria bacterium GW2011_GWD2_36_12]KKQ06589.1 MAG: hypothetical protein US16_C0013G0001 [Candidatus Moranbacteria bacterium GW2011_GWE2_36_40]KKQ15534.1 MAG: hypothetical protein US25_C0002G0001 [Candidatus Moranbacteria bacterium GW2011_GWE1_36_7]